MSVIPKNLCKKCANYKTCTRLCYPIEKYLKEKGECFERDGVLYPLYKQIPFSVYLQEPNDGKRQPNDEEKLLTDELESPFKSINPKLKMTGVFIHRFFLHYNYKDIAFMFGISVKSAQNLYQGAVKKLMAQLEALDQDGRQDIASNHYKKAFRKKARNIPKNKKWWIMVNYFGLTPSEVAEIENITARYVSSAICRYNQRVRAGKAILK